MVTENPIDRGRGRSGRGGRGERGLTGGGGTFDRASPDGPSGGTGSTGKRSSHLPRMTGDGEFTLRIVTVGRGAIDEQDAERADRGDARPGPGRLVPALRPGDGA